MYSVYHKKLSLPIKLLFKIERPLNTFHPSSINPKNTLNFFGGGVEPWYLVEKFTFSLHSILLGVQPIHNIFKKFEKHASGPPLLVPQQPYKNSLNRKKVNVRNHSHIIKEDKNPLSGIIVYICIYTRLEQNDFCDSGRSFKIYFLPVCYRFLCVLLWPGFKRLHPILGRFDLSGSFILLSQGTLLFHN